MQEKGEGSPPLRLFSEKWRWRRWWFCAFSSLASNKKYFTPNLSHLPFNLDKLFPFFFSFPSYVPIFFPSMLLFFVFVKKRFCFLFSLKCKRVSVFCVCKWRTGAFHKLLFYTRVKTLIEYYELFKVKRGVTKLKENFVKVFDVGTNTRSCKIALVCSSYK